jgi:hypothetical protein
MREHVPLVFGVRLPRQVTWIHAAEVTVPTRVGGLVLRCRWLAVNRDADDTMDAALLPGDLRIAVIIARVRPKQTVVTFAVERYPFDEASWSTIVGELRVRQRIAVAFPALPVRAAITLSVMLTTATFDRALASVDVGSCHRDLLERPLTLA